MIRVQKQETHHHSTTTNISQIPIPIRTQNRSELVKPRLECTQFGSTNPNNSLTPKGSFLQIRRRTSPSVRSSPRAVTPVDR
ncbi:unnamed protein product [Tuber melanosporum]|uniref:(Perigord truffle) hypothetical protein n=1 Tax=Tuber melanosporum (strain Mel28) TaxID=656061 RepID=D5GDM9_TUBMM|nr:uncharacterized protein GSTUM_00001125001 [Tuber melanosporum]CAZ82622.1 unnamed protein product [Tuber melanosporum]